MRIKTDMVGKTLAAALREEDSQRSWGQARKLCLRGKVWLNGEVSLDSARRLEKGDLVEVRKDAPRPSKGNLPKAEVLHQDADLLIVNKPPGLLTLPVSDEDQASQMADTLMARVRFAVDQRQTRKPSLSFVHRLDRNTSGLLVVCRTREATRDLKAQFFAHTIERSYLALAYGTPYPKAKPTTPVTIRSHLIEDRGDGIRGSFGHYKRGSGDPPPYAKVAITHLRFKQRFAQATLVECKLETGRQHQIRIHLSEAGAPLLGENVYIRDFPGARIPAKRHMLHAQTLGFIHPRSKEEMHFRVDPPQDFQTLWKKLSLQKKGAW